ncbi:unnamed protein product [Rangifer tarandus platyrhynchus]|uniref:Uncharacterized protein n=2 Tax=Rangifer tarandus platyrhynchus TaxID=3082113 RepID=A0ACB0EL92_RANTA|nr:unnamed protein product [Rangifer tarandus platyrhynchus]CAI9701435.1 unnamed protein product [Rangifer tarandus platyrhynchus]
MLIPSSRLRRKTLPSTLKRANETLETRWRAARGISGRRGRDSDVIGLYPASRRSGRDGLGSAPRPLSGEQKRHFRFQLGLATSPAFMRWGTEGFSGKNNEKTRNIAKNHSSGRQRSDVSQPVFGRAEVTRLEEQGDTGRMASRLSGKPPGRPLSCLLPAAGPSSGLQRGW